MKWVKWNSSGCALLSLPSSTLGFYVFIWGHISSIALLSIFVLWPLLQPLVSTFLWAPIKINSQLLSPYGNTSTLLIPFCCASMNISSSSTCICGFSFVLCFFCLHAGFSIFFFKNYLFGVMLRLLCAHFQDDFSLYLLHLVGWYWSVYVLCILFVSVIGHHGFSCITTILASCIVVVICNYFFLHHSFLPPTFTYCCQVICQVVFHF